MQTAATDLLTDSGKPLLVVILGPTASGKSSLAVNLAQQIPGEVVNCDSRQLIRGFDAGTDKPTAMQRSAVPHHLYDVVGPQVVYSAGRYMSEARMVCREIAVRGHVPIVVGGTGLYLRALLRGVFEGPGRSDPLRHRLRRIAEKRGSEYLHRLLARKDPQAAAAVQTADLVRIIRALEVCFLTGRPFSELQTQTTPLRGFRICRIGLNLPRPQLYDRIDRRVVEIFDSSLLQEVRMLLKSGVSSASPGFQSLGYPRALSHIKGEITLAEAIALTQRDTRRYAKRQMTWFRREKDVEWLTTPGEDPLTLKRSLTLICQETSL